MSKHNVKMKLQSGLLVQKGDVNFDVKKDSGRFGTLKVSQGSVEWRPKDHTYVYRMKWADLNEIFREYGQRTRK